jgi:hypothetical protein
MRDKFTQGPWETKADANALGAIVYSKDSVPIAICNPVSVCTGSGVIKRYTREEAAANAQLIAVAPELLKALRDVVHSPEHLTEAVLNFARATIAKATNPSATDGVA